MAYDTVQEKKNNIQAHDDSVLETINPNFVRSNTMSTISEFINDESNDSWLQNIFLLKDHVF